MPTRGGRTGSQRAADSWGALLGPPEFVTHIGKGQNAAKGKGKGEAFGGHAAWWHGLCCGGHRGVWQVGRRAQPHLRVHGLVANLFVLRAGVC